MKIVMAGPGQAQVTRELSPQEEGEATIEASLNLVPEVMSISEGPFQNEDGKSENSNKENLNHLINFLNKRNKKKSGSTIKSKKIEIYQKIAETENPENITGVLLDKVA